MNTYLRLGLLLLGFLVLNTVLSQAKIQTKNIILDSLLMNNIEMKDIMDSLIVNEKKCDYYHDSLVFGIDIFDYDQDTIQISFSSNKNKCAYLNGEPIGYLYYKDYLFIIGGDNKSDLLYTSCKKRVFSYLLPDLSETKGHTTIVSVIEDDRYTMRLYYFINGHFVFESGYPPCPR